MTIRKDRTTLMAQPYNGYVTGAGEPYSLFLDVSSSADYSGLIVINRRRSADGKKISSMRITVDEAKDLIDALHKHIRLIENDRYRYTTDLYTADEQSTGELQEGC